MKITVALDALRDALTITRPAVASKTALPILACTLLEADGSTLRVAATNLTIGIATTVAAEITEPGWVAVDAGSLREFVATLTGDRVSLTLDPQSLRLTVSCGHDTARMSGINGDDFPRLPEAGATGTTVTFAPDTIRDAVRLLPMAVATNDSRPILTGVGLTVKGNNAVWGASDGFRMASLECDVEASGDLATVIPAAALRALEPIVAETEDAVTITATENGNQLVAEIGATRWSSRVIDGTYPDVVKIAPRTFSTTIEVQAAALQRAMRQANIFARENDQQKSKVVRLGIAAGPDDLTPGSLTVEASSAENHGAMEAVLPCAQDGADLAILLNGPYMVDYLAAVKQGTVTLHANEPNNPVVLRTPATPRYQYIVMPMVIGGA